MKGLLVALGPKGKGAPPSDEEDDASESEGSEEEYGTMLADIAGVAKEDRSDFVDALRGFVKSCMRKSKSGDY